MKMQLEAQETCRNKAHCDIIVKKPDEGFLGFTMEQRLNVPNFDNVI